MTKAGEQPTITQAVKAASETLWHHGVVMHPDDIAGLVQDVAVALRTTSLAAQDGLVEAVEALLSALGFAEFDVLDSHNLPFPKPTVGVAAKKLNAALSAIKGDKS